MKYSRPPTAVRAGPLRPEDRRRLVRLRARQARRHPGRGGTDDRRAPQELGITPRKISDEEIVQRLVFALVNEGAHILEDGIASKSGDIDMVYLTGYGFPLARRPHALRQRSACSTWCRP
jgi:hypothetical protein